MKKRSWKQIKLAALTLTVFWLCAGAALAAGGGTQSDPLVTLSYLTQTVQPDILRQAEERAAAAAAKTAQAAEADAAKLRDAAEKRLEAAAEFIVGRVVKH